MWLVFRRPSDVNRVPCRVARIPSQQVCAPDVTWPCVPTLLQTFQFEQNVGLFVRCWCAGVGFLLDFFFWFMSAHNSFDLRDISRLSLGTAIFFATKVAICISLAFSIALRPSWVSNRSNMDAILFSQAPLQAQPSIFPSAAVIVPIL